MRLTSVGALLQQLAVEPVSHSEMAGLSSDVTGLEAAGPAPRPRGDTRRQDGTQGEDGSSRLDRREDDKEEDEPKLSWVSTHNSHHCVSLNDTHYLPFFEIMALGILYIITVPFTVA